MNSPNEDFIKRLLSLANKKLNKNWKLQDLVFSESEFSSPIGDTPDEFFGHVGQLHWLYMNDYTELKFSSFGIKKDLIRVRKLTKETVDEYRIDKERRKRGRKNGR